MNRMEIKIIKQNNYFSNIVIISVNYFPGNPTVLKSKIYYSNQALFHKNYTSLTKQSSKL